jgi:hypothetical protein
MEEVRLDTRPSFIVVATMVDLLTQGTLKKKTTCRYHYHHLNLYVLLMEFYKIQNCFYFFLLLCNFEAFCDWYCESTSGTALCCEGVLLSRYSNPKPTCALWQAAALTYELCYILFKLVHVWWRYSASPQEVHSEQFAYTFVVCIPKRRPSPKFQCSGPTDILFIKAFFDFITQVEHI